MNDKVKISAVAPVAPVAENPAAKLAQALLARLGDASYSVAPGNVTLYPDKRRAGVKNGRAGHVSFAVSGAASISASIYMDVEPVVINGENKTKKTYRLSFPKGVTVNLGPESEANAFRRMHTEAWKNSRTAKTLTTDAEAGDSTVTEID